mmetsp:Transcript_10657/g.33436  ORF Transcript_10657/g.33436 Transcript_10657/m.33436 type:complete len:104 (-) Transcript_10657:43-354(-)
MQGDVIWAGPPTYCGGPLIPTDDKRRESSLQSWFACRAGSCCMLVTPVLAASRSKKQVPKSIGRGAARVCLDVAALDHSAEPGLGRCANTPWGLHWLDSACRA